MSTYVIKFADGREPKIGEAVIIQDQICYYTGNRRFSTITLPASAVSYDSCETAVLSTGGTLEKPSYPVQDYCHDTDMDVELDRMYINPYDDISPGDKVFFNGRGFIKTGNTGTATHVLTAMPLVVDYDETCVQASTATPTEETVSLLPCSAIGDAYIWTNGSYIAPNSNFRISGFDTLEQGQAWVDAMNTPHPTLADYRQDLKVGDEIIRVRTSAEWLVSPTPQTPYQQTTAVNFIYLSIPFGYSYDNYEPAREYHRLLPKYQRGYSHQNFTSISLAECDQVTVSVEDDPHGRFSACGSGCDFIPVTQDDMSNIDGRWLHTGNMTAQKIYQADMSVSYIDTGSAVDIQEISTSTISDSLKEFFEPATHMLRINTGSSTSMRSAMLTYADRDTTGIGAFSCVNVSFKYSHITGGGGDGVNCGIVVRQGGNYFAQFLGTTGQSDQAVVTLEKQLSSLMWLRLGGSGTTFYPDFGQPCDYGLIFANTSVNVQAYITDIKVCVNHDNPVACKVSDYVFADWFTGAEKHAIGAFNGELDRSSAGYAGSWAAWSNGDWQTTGTIDQKLDKPRKVVRYRIFPVRIHSRTKDPKSWEMQGSNDGTNYVVLDTRTNQSLTPNEWNSYTMNNQNEYLYYRFYVIENNGDSRYVHVQELELYNCV